MKLLNKEKFLEKKENCFEIKNWSMGKIKVKSCKKWDGIPGATQLSNC